MIVAAACASTKVAAAGGLLALAELGNWQQTSKTPVLVCHFYTVMFCQPSAGVLVR